MGITPHCFERDSSISEVFSRERMFWGIDRYLESNDDEQCGESESVSNDSHEQWIQFIPSVHRRASGSSSSLSNADADRQWETLKWSLRRGEQPWLFLRVWWCASILILCALSISQYHGGTDGFSIVFLFTKQSDVDFSDGKGIEHDRRWTRDERRDPQLTWNSNQTIDRQTAF